MKLFIGNIVETLPGKLQANFLPSLLAADPQNNRTSTKDPTVRVTGGIRHQDTPP
jgi:hypothetical protein